MKKYTVLLVQEYTAESWQDTYIAHVEADDVKGAVKKAQITMFDEQGREEDGEMGEVLAVFEGHLEDKFSAHADIR
jgi:hypothetical protein